MILFSTADGKLSPEESKIMTYKSIYDFKQMKIIAEYTQLKQLRNKA